MKTLLPLLLPLPLPNSIIKKLTTDCRFDWAGIGFDLGSYVGN